MHLNIPEHDNPTFLGLSYQTWRKFGWLLIGLLAPEMLVYTAWYQRSEAKNFVEEYNRYFGLSPSPGLFAKGGKCHRILRKIFHLKVERSFFPILSLVWGFLIYTFVYTPSILKPSSKTLLTYTAIPVSEYTK